jgi:hypothetical protein
MPSTIAIERNRALIHPMMPKPGLGLTSQIVLSESWSSPKTPLAPNRAMITARMVAMVPAPGLPAYLIAS